MLHDLIPSSSNGKSDNSRFCTSRLLAWLEMKSSKSLSSQSTGWRQKALELHNFYRAKHSVPALSLDSELNVSAQRCAEHLAANKILAHNCEEIFGFKYGENLAAITCGDPEFAVPYSVKRWYSEVSEYSYEKSEFQASTGHFTQVVWKSSERIGVGFAKSENFYIVVAHYDPPGNYRTLFRNNVLKPTRKVQSTNR